MQITINETKKSFDNAITFSLVISEMPIESVKCISETLPIRIQEAFKDFMKFKYGINLDKKIDSK